MSRDNRNEMKNIHVMHCVPQHSSYLVFLVNYRRSTSPQESVPCIFQRKYESHITVQIHKRRTKPLREPNIHQRANIREKRVKWDFEPLEGRSPMDVRQTRVSMSTSEPETTYRCSFFGAALPSTFRSEQSRSALLADKHYQRTTLMRTTSGIVVASTTFYEP